MSSVRANQSSAFIASTIYGRGVDEILSRNNYGSNQYILPDRNGNTLAITGATGLILESYRYDAFGAPTIRKADGTISQMTRADGSVIPVSAINNRFLFTGREYAAKFGFYEYRARAYHPGLGRFMSEDPKGFDAGDYNLYRYCDNDPLDLTDPMGLEEVDIDFRAFISQASVGPYRGDNRGFSTAANASSRVAVSVRVETDPSRNNGRVMVGTPRVAVSSTHNNSTGRESTSTGPMPPRVTASRDNNCNAVVNVQMNMRNPEQSVGRGISSNVNISVNQAATNGSVSGTVSRNPSSEVVFGGADGSRTMVPLQSESQTQSRLLFGAGLQLDKKVEVSVPLKYNQ